MKFLCHNDEFISYSQTETSYFNLKCSKFAYKCIYIKYISAVPHEFSPLVLYRMRKGTPCRNSSFLQDVPSDNFKKDSFLPFRTGVALVEAVQSLYQQVGTVHQLVADLRYQQFRNSSGDDQLHRCTQFLFDPGQHAVHHRRCAAHNARPHAFHSVAPEHLDLAVQRDGRKLGGAAGERLCRDAHARRNDDAADIRLGIDHSKGCGSTEVHDGQRAFKLTEGLSSLFIWFELVLEH